jgi:hypothetical protein
MSRKKIYYLLNLDDGYGFQEGDEILFEMPPFCSGDYRAIVKKDNRGILYIDGCDNHFDSCRDYEVWRLGKLVNKIGVDEQQMSVRNAGEILKNRYAGINNIINNSRVDSVYERSAFVADLNAVYKDIMAIEIQPTDTFISMMDRFYAVMRKWGICQGTWSTNGRLCNTAEWNMCYSVFKLHKIMALDIWLVLNEPPEDLRAYGRCPHKDNDDEQ